MGTSSYNQSCYIEVVQGDIFTEQKMRFRLVLGWLAVLKKKVWVDYEKCLRAVFQVLMAKKTLDFFSNIAVSSLKTCIE